MIKLPLFPLNLILLPYEYLPLHIFEPRYKRVIKNAIEKNIAFGIILSQGDGVFTKGVRVAITEVLKEYKNGEYDILVKGKELFNVISTDMDGDTVIGKIEYIPITMESDDVYFQEVQDAYLKVLLKLGVDKNFDFHLGKKISYEFLQELELPISMKKDLMNIDNESDRLFFIKKIFNQIIDLKIKPKTGNIPEA